MITEKTNANTVAMDGKFITLSPDNSWKSKDIEELGHELLEVVVRGIRYTKDDDDRKPLLLSYRGKNLMDAGNNPMVVRMRFRMIPEMSAVNLGGGELFDENAKIIVGNMKAGKDLNKFVVKVIKIKTCNLESGQITDWRAKQSTVTVLNDDLFLYSVDGTKYTDLTYRALISAADLLACKECNYSVGTTVKGQDRCVITGRPLSKGIKHILRKKEDTELKGFKLERV